ncbi:MAG: Hsp20/alpha crystallin family protein [Desulfatibacillum sp.]|nr:Hsp20/alpha crystallin family protein [Desulfatibacillum sp.]
MTGLLPLLTGTGGFRRPHINALDRFLLDSGLLENNCSSQSRDTWMPAMDVVEREGDFVIQAEVPGLDKKDIEIILTQGLLTIKGAKSQTGNEKQDLVHISERRFGSFTKSLRLPDTIDATGVQAATKDGVLTITLPKAEKEKPRRIVVQN